MHGQAAPSSDGVKALPRGWRGWNDIVHVRGCVQVMHGSACRPHANTSFQHACFQSRLYFSYLSHLSSKHSTGRIRLYCCCSIPKLHALVECVAQSTHAARETKRIGHLLCHRTAADILKLKIVNPNPSAHTPADAKKSLRILKFLSHFWKTPLKDNMKHLSKYLRMS